MVCYRAMKGSPAKVILGIDIDDGIPDEGQDRLGRPAARREVQRRHPVLVGLVHPGAQFNSKHFANVLA